jgi:predicted nicotinamide N-methyase
MAHDMNWQWNRETELKTHDWYGFILANTKLLSPPLVPEVKLRLAQESLPIWRKTEEELGKLNLAPPYWAFAWAGGQALARYIIDHPTLIEGKHVLDLGSGSGLTGISALMKNAELVLAADIDPVALVAITINAATNNVSIETTADDLLGRPPSGFDVILVGDLFYERQLAERVLAFIVAAVANGALALIGDPQRNFFPQGRFEPVAEYRVPVTRELEDAEIKRTAVWRLGRAPSG